LDIGLPIFDAAGFGALPFGDTVAFPRAGA
jgi:hypothetical protein